MAIDGSSADGAALEEVNRTFSSFTDNTLVQSTVIIGAGIIGCSTAYYLSHSGHTKPDNIHLVEASPELFASASGKAAGFLASDWFGPSTAGLGKLSFRLHRELAEQHEGRKEWGYSRSTGTSLAADRQKTTERGEDWLAAGGSRDQVAGQHSFHSDDSGGPAWLAKREGDRVDIIGADDSVAQVDPLRLSKFLLKESVLKGVRLHQPAKAMRVSRNDVGELSALRIRYENGIEQKIPCTRLLIAAGAWSQRVFETLFPTSPIEIPISQLAGHSLVVKSPRWTAEHEAKGCHAVFSSSRSGFSPEVFSRIGGEIYIAGLNAPEMELPDIATDAKIDAKAVEKLKEVAEEMLGRDGTDVSDLQIVRQGVCFRPVSESGKPILARVPDEDLGRGIETKETPNGGVFVATGHGPWGISQSLGTGKVMAEMMEGEELSADVTRLGL